MGNKRKSLKDQAYQILTSMYRKGKGRSKHIDKINGCTEDKIYSSTTYKAYRKIAGYYIDFLRTNYPEIGNDLQAGKRYIGEWQEKLKAEGKKATTISTYLTAVGKLYHVHPGSPYYVDRPARHQQDIVNSRYDVPSDKRFDVQQHADLIDFARGTGLRSECELHRLRGMDLLTRPQIEIEIEQLQDQLTAMADAQWDCRTQRLAAKKRLKMLLETRLFDVNNYIHVRKGKNGRQRISPIIGEHIDDIVHRMCDTDDLAKVWPKIPCNANIQSFRGDYCCILYLMVARDPKDIPYDGVCKGTTRRHRSDLYACRGAKAGVRYDRAALSLCSVALGHGSGRTSDIAAHYLYRLDYWRDALGK